MNNKDTAMHGESLNIAEQRKKELKQLFPSAFTETKNDKGEIVETLDFERGGFNLEVHNSTRIVKEISCL